MYLSVQNKGLNLILTHSLQVKMPTAHMLIRCDPRYREEIVKQISELKGVKEAHGMYGAYDIIAKLVSDSMDSLRDTVTTDVNNIAHIHAKATLITIEGQG